jgi:hypothetical protein
MNRGVADHGHAGALDGVAGDRGHADRHFLAILRLLLRSDGDRWHPEAELRVVVSRFGRLREGGGSERAGHGEAQRQRPGLPREAAG